MANFVLFPGPTKYFSRRVPFGSLTRGGTRDENANSLLAIAVEGATMLMVAGNSMGTNWKGHYTTSLLDFYGRSRRVRANDLSETVKLVILLGQYMQDNYQGRYYAKAQNLARTLRAAYDEALNGKQAGREGRPSLSLSGRRA
jgi:hypothetical protein